MIVYFQYLSWANAILYSDYMWWGWVLVCIAELVPGFWGRAACISRAENPCENNSFLLLSVLGHLYPEFRHNTMEMGEKKILFIDSFHSIQMNSDDWEQIGNTQSNLNPCRWYILNLSFPVNPFKDTHPHARAHTHTNRKSVNVNVAVGFNLFYLLIQKSLMKIWHAKKIESYLIKSIKWIRQF